MRNVTQKNLLILVVAICVFLINQLPFLTDMRPVMYDEAWYGNTAYNFAIGNGFLNTAVGTRGNSNFIFPLIAGISMHLFGYNLLSIRLAAVFCGILTILFIWLALRQLKVSSKAYCITFAFFLSIALYNTIYRFGRPECAALMNLAGGIWMYLRYRETHSWLDMMGLSCFTYLATCAHPYALLFFALLGIYLLWDTLHQREWKRLLQLSVLLVAAIAALASIMWVSAKYNIAEENYINERFSPKNIALALPSYLESAFLSKHTIYTLPLLVVLIAVAWKDKVNRELAIIGLIYFCIFPFLFSTDLAMVGLGIDYVALLATILLALLGDKIGYKKWTVSLFAAYCFLNMMLSYYYNYAVKYEKANTVLTHDLQTIIPKNVKVFGSIRQWPIVMQTEYQSDHTCFEVLPQTEYDYIIYNSHDALIYSPYQTILPIDTLRMELVYERETKQYGLIKVYHNKHNKSH